MIRQFLPHRFQKPGWHIDGNDSEQHLWPCRDLVQHEPEDCICFPQVAVVTQEDGSDLWLYRHSSLDGRELREDEETVITIDARYVAAGATALLIGRRIWRKFR